MENRKIILYSLFADLLGVLLFIFAIQMHSNVILYSFYLISILLFINLVLIYLRFKSISINPKSPVISFCKI